jgi:NADH-quinone oxidoreductase subunit N
VLLGLFGLFVASTFVAPGRSILDGRFVLDDLALLAKQVFLIAAGISVLASTALQHPAMERRSPEYHFALLASLIGMMALVSSRDLVLMFVAFELMSIPLYVLTGFQKGEPVAAEAALKFFLIGTVSSALVLYGLSFVYGVTGTMDSAAIGPAIREGHPLLALGLGLVLAGVGFKIAAVPFHMWVPDTYEAAGTPFVAWLSVAPKAAGFVLLCRLYLQGAGMAALVWLPVLSALAAVTIIAGNLMAIPQRNIKRLLAYSGIAHIGYMLMALAAISNAGVAMLLFYVVAYLFGNMGAFLVVQAVSASERSESIDAYRGLAQRSPVLALTMLIFLLSLGGIPFVAGFWAKLYVFWARPLAHPSGPETRHLHVRRRCHRDGPVSRTLGPRGAQSGRRLAGKIGRGLKPFPFSFVTLPVRGRPSSDAADRGEAQRSQAAVRGTSSSAGAGDRCALRQVHDPSRDRFRRRAGHLPARRCAWRAARERPRGRRARVAGDPRHRRRACRHSRHTPRSGLADPV